MDQEDHPSGDTHRQSSPMDEQDNPSNVNEYPRGKDSYRILNQLSQGVGSLVYKAICVPFKSMVAIKIINLDKPMNRTDIPLFEAKNADLPCHPNILKPYCYFIEEAQLWVVMPYIAGGSLQSIISYSFAGGLPPKCIATVLEKILSALVRIHAQGYPHGGIKPGNILLDSNGDVALSDFGVSVSNFENESSYGNLLSSSSTQPLMIAAPPYWLAPEAIPSELRFYRKSDIWSFGITALEMFYGRPPTSRLPDLSKYMHMKISKRFQFSDHYEKGKVSDADRIIQKSLKNMISSCLELDSLKRPSAQELLSHPFFSDKCKGPGYLVRTVMQNLPSVKRRLKDPKIHKSLPSETGDRGNADPRRLIGWVFNQEEFELEPVFLGNGGPNRKLNEPIEIVVGKIKKGEPIDYPLRVKAMEALGEILTEQIDELERLTALTNSSLGAQQSENLRKVIIQDGGLDQEIVKLIEEMFGKE